MAFLPKDFAVPTLVAGPRFRILPLTIHDAVRLYDAMMSSRDELYEQFGEAWQWPPADFTLEQCMIDVAWQQKEGELRRSFGFIVVTADEARMIGYIRVAPSKRTGGEAMVTYWVRSAARNRALEEELGDFVEEWTTTAWPFKEVHFPGRRIAWSAYRALPVREG